MATLQDLIEEFKTVYTDAKIVNPDIQTLLLNKIAQSGGGGGGGGSANTEQVEGVALTFGVAVQAKDGSGDATFLGVDASGNLKVTAQGIRDRLPTQQGTFAKSATVTTNATQDTWDEVLAARPTRVAWTVANLSDTLILVGYGGTGTEQIYLPIPSYSAIGQSINQVNFSDADIGIISVICPLASSKDISVTEVYI